MNAIRTAISVFLVILLGLVVAGWIWAGTLPDAKMAGARAVLAACGLSAVGALALIWKEKSQPAG